MPPRHQYRIRNRIVSRATYYRYLRRNRNVIHSETSGSDGSSSPLSPSSSSPSSIAPMTALESPESPSEVMEGIAFNEPPILSPHGRTGDSEFHIEELELPIGVAFIDGRIPHYPLQEPNIRQSIENEVLGLQADLDAADVPIAIQDKIIRRFFKRENQDQHGNLLDYAGMGIGQLMNIAESNSVDYFAPSSWDQIERFYKDRGMISPIRYRLCTGKEGIPHSPILMEPSNEDFYEGPHIVKCTCGTGNTRRLAKDCTNCSTKCPKCGIQRKHVLAFDYLPFGSRIAFMCKSRTICYDFLEVWRKRNDWLGRDMNHQPHSISQFWHGKKMREVQDFWNPEKHWELPIHCSGPNCNFIFRAFPSKCVELQRGWNNDLNKYHFPCPHCGFNIDESPSLIQGDPRNFAIAAHWDGFQAATTKYKDCWAVEIEILNGGIQNLIRPMPVIFIPASSKKILKDIEEQVMTVFLEPFIRELESVFIHGFDVDYNFPSEDISLNIDLGSGNLKARAMLIYWTGDHPAQCKVAGFKLLGYHACRRCHMVEKSIGRNVTYPDNRRQAQYDPPIPRTIESIYLEAQALNTPSTSTRTRRQNNVTTYSKLWRLYHLYGFNLSLDLVYDSMHILPLNIFKTFVEYLVSQGRSGAVDNALLNITKHRPKDLGGRWPSDCANRLSYWRAEEYQNFVQWCLPYCIQEINVQKTEKLYGIGQILTEIARLFFSHSRTNGWTNESISIARSLLSAWRIHWEELVGPNGSILQHVAGSGEMLDDILRHGPHDLYWCYRFERNVSSYKSIKTNQKQSEITYSKYESRVAFTSIQEKITKDKDNLYPPQRAVLEIHKQLLRRQHRPGGGEGVDQHVCPNSHKKGIILTNSIKDAKRLEKLQKLLPRCVCKELIQLKGISVGWKNGNMKQMNRSVETYMRKYWREEGILNDITEENFSKEIERISFVIFHGVHYRIGDHIIAREDGHELDPLHELGYSTYKAKITMFFIHELMGHYRLFFQAKFFRQIPNTSSSIIPMLSDFSSMVLLTPTPVFFRENDCRPIHVLLHKFMDQPIPQRTDAIVALELADVTVRKHLVQMGEPGYCPPWPQVSNIMYCRQNKEEPLKVDIVVIREVMLPRHLEDGGNNEDRGEDEPYIGHVLVNVLELQNRERGIYKVATGSIRFHCSWTCLLGHVEESGFPIAFDNAHNAPIRWQGIKVVSNYRRGLLTH